MLFYWNRQKSIFFFSTCLWSFSFFLAFLLILFGTFYKTICNIFTLGLMRFVFPLHFFLSCIPSACLGKMDTHSCFSQGAYVSVDTSEIISVDFNSWLVLSSKQIEKELWRMVTNIILSCLYKNVIIYVYCINVYV